MSNIEAKLRKVNAALIASDYKTRDLAIGMAKEIMDLLFEGICMECGSTTEGHACQCN